MNEIEEASDKLKGLSLGQICILYGAAESGGMSRKHLDFILFHLEMAIMEEKLKRSSMAMDEES